MSDTPPELLLAHCTDCGAWTWPANAWGCRRCGAEPGHLAPRPPPATPRLCNAVTVHAELAPGLPVPCVIGEVELAPGVVEEALIATADESTLVPGMALRPQARADEHGCVHWSFAPEQRS